jgi:predicted Rossmann-fold nucleotide-binding protein
MRRALVLAVIGAGDAPEDVCAMAREVGREIAARGAMLINGGRGGVMKAAAEGARGAGGHTLGIIPSYDRAGANEFIEFVIAVIAMAGEGGTLAEIGFAKKFGRPIIALNSWLQIDGLQRATTAREAVDLAIKLAAH